MNPISGVKRHACHYCDKRFERSYNLRRHVENIHAEDESETHEDDGYDAKPDFKRRRIEDSELEDSASESTQDTDDSEEGDITDVETDESGSSADEDDSSSDVEDNVTYRYWLEEAKEATEEMWSHKYEKYINDGMSGDQAKEKANMKTLWAVKRIFFNKYKDFLSSYLHLKDNEAHQDIVEDLEEKVGKGMEVNTALNRLLPKYQMMFEGLFQQDEQREDEEDSDD